tara:strand:- start:543 stop:764 length:222 start_codon:yes stop_codon:yes gene_type:complete
MSTNDGKLVSRYKDIFDYFEIKADSNDIKRVEQLAEQLDEAVAKNDEDKIKQVEMELTNYKCNDGKYFNYKFY